MVQLGEPVNDILGSDRHYVSLLENPNRPHQAPYLAAKAYLGTGLCRGGARDAPVKTGSWGSGQQAGNSSIIPQQEPTATC